LNYKPTARISLGKLFKKKEGVASAKAQDQSGDSFPER
jgi:hypothetical protein